MNPEFSFLGVASFDMRHLAGISLSEVQFGQLRSLCGDDCNFPATWNDWKSLIAEANQRAVEADDAVGIVEFTVDTSGFSSWCGKVAVMPSLDALRAYAILARRRLLEKT